MFFIFSSITPSCIFRQCLRLKVNNLYLSRETVPLINFLWAGLRLWIRCGWGGRIREPQPPHKALLNPLKDKTRRQCKCRHLTKLTFKGTLLQVFISLRPRTPYPPPTHCICVYCIHIHTGGGERDNTSQSWVGNTNMTDCSKVP